MKTSVMIAGVCCLLALSLTLSECQNATCDINSDLQDCIDEFTADPENVCGGCRSVLDEYADECLSGAAAEAYRDGLDAACGADAIVAAVLTTISALVLAMAAVFN